MTCWWSSVDKLSLRLGDELQRRQRCLDLGSFRFEERRQRQTLTQVIRFLVGGEAGAIGRDLEKHAARLAEVERPEVVAVDHRRDADTRPGQALAPGAVLVVIRRAKRHMMHAADADRRASSRN